MPLITSHHLSIGYRLKQNASIGKKNSIVESALIKVHSGHIFELTGQEKRSILVFKYLTVHENQMNLIHPVIYRLPSVL